MVISRYLHEYATRAAGLLGDDVEASITMRQHGLTLRGGSSTPDAARCDQAEAMADAGPCVEAMTTATILVVPSVEDDDRWLAWREQSIKEGFVKALALPARVTPGIVVALNLYSRSPAAWEEKMVRAGDSYARLIASGVRLQLEFSDLEDAAASLYQAMSGTVAVERAVGAIIQTNDCTEAQARDLLRTAAEDQGVGERTIAVTILRSLAVGGPGRRR
ncbi:GAF and ANTAR domain-containing protein [Isoptericola sp. NEAU-Y5]|uniref:GAF and ANTAR domain-containing protein n=1 Tax=Isoptericola luteus TaxID=2879484 RepID=A0ABS7ZK04_9MICO|nr:GAF and ANTAR domain-containing protein [Isoptericola sp. NEAU-Y5]MCA5893964.1 GAF and ANTAR domain-containing protein [Isoptericola sp. NEAU-Y5]